MAAAATAAPGAGSHPASASRVLPASPAGAAAGRDDDAGRCGGRRSVVAGLVVGVVIGSVLRCAGVRFGGGLAGRLGAAAGGRPGGGPGGGWAGVLCPAMASMSSITELVAAVTAVCN